MNMTRLFPLCICLMLMLNSYASAKSYTFQGKASVHIQRVVTLPFVLQVKEVQIAVGETVQKGARLLRYELKPQDARSYHSLLSAQAVGMAVRRQQRAALGQETQTASLAAQRDRKLHGQGLAPKADLRRNSAVLSTLSAREEQLRVERETNEQAYDLLLQELSEYFGCDLKRGDMLPSEFWLTAPITGTVIDINNSARPGGIILPNTAAFTVGVTDPIQIDLQVFESEAASLRVGDSVVVEVPSLGKRQFPGRVVSVSWATQDKIVANPTFYLAVVDVDNKEGAIRPGFKVIAHVTVE